MARNARDGSERLAANIALLQFMENPPAWTVAGGDPAAAVGLLREAKANWAAAQRAKNLSQRVAKAELKDSGTYSGLSLEAMLRARSPLAVQTALPRPPGALPLAALAPSVGGDQERLGTLATLGQ